MKILKEHKTFGGFTRFCEHDSTATGTKMKFSTFTPPGEVRGAIFFLSGLTCTDENFITKAGAQRYLAESHLMVICPDTSPRGLNLPGEHESDNFGSGASFYLDATTPGYRDHYRMFTYVTQELYALAQTEFKLGDRISLMGHSMGGHGALVLGLREAGKFKSVSAFAPIVNPSRGPWGQGAFTGYLGADPAAWKAFDATELIAAGKKHPRKILIDQGEADPFLQRELFTQHFADVCRKHGQDVELRFQPGYDHAYYFIQSFVGEHIRFHANAIVG